MSDMLRKMGNARTGGRPGGAPSSARRPPAPKRARPTATDQPKTWILDSNNWQLGKDLLPEVVLNRVKNGDYWYKVVQVDPEKFKQNYSQKFWEASEANAGKYDVDPATCGLKDVKTGKMPDFYFGYPFPKIDPKDPQAACKMAWNFDGRELDGRGPGRDLHAQRHRQQRRVQAHQAVAARQLLPRPPRRADPQPGEPARHQHVQRARAAGRRRRRRPGQAHQRLDVAGPGLVLRPATRRVRRVNAATRSDPVAGLDIFADDLNCYAGKVEYYKWKLIGEGNVLAPVLSPEPLLSRSTSHRPAGTVDIPYFKGAYETPGAKGAPG